MMGFSRASLAALLVMIVLVLVAPFVLYPVFLMKVLCFALFACAFNLLIGYVGLMSFGHAAYFGMGAYVTAWTAKVWHLTPEVAIVLGGIAGAALGLVFGWLAIRRAGIQQVPRGALFGIFPLASDMAIYWVIAALFIAVFLLIHRIVHSPFGQVLKAIRENEPRAISLGYRTDDYKLIAFVISAAVAGIAGGAKSLVFGIATLTDVHFSMSGDVVLMTLLGGMGTIFGPVMGALITTSMENYLAQFGAWVTVTQGVIFVLCVLAFRRGVIGELGARLKIAI
jgi:branched-chain amino acid transport system permease protein